MLRIKGLKRTFVVFLVLIRLLLAFPCGWKLASLFAMSDGSGLIEGSFLLFLVFPPLLVIVTEWMVDRQNKHLILIAIGTGLPFIAGIYTYWLPLASHQDAVMTAMCANTGVHCHVGPVEVLLLNAFLCYDIVMVLLGAVITGLIIKHRLKKQMEDQLLEPSDER